jgi:hypothetical protein
MTKMARLGLAVAVYPNVGRRVPRVVRLAVGSFRPVFVVTINTVQRWSNGVPLNPGKLERVPLLLGRPGCCCYGIPIVVVVHDGFT